MGGGCLVSWRMFSNIPASTHQMPVEPPTSLLSLTTQNISRCCQISPVGGGGKLTPIENYRSLPLSLLPLGVGGYQPYQTGCEPWPLTCGSALGVSCRLMISGQIGPCRHFLFGMRDVFRNLLLAFCQILASNILEMGLYRLPFCMTASVRGPTDRDVLSDEPQTSPLPDVFPIPRPVCRCGVLLFSFK